MADINDAIVALIHRCYRTDGNAGWILAMVAARDLKNTTSIRVGSLLHVLHPRTIHPKWNVVLRFARYCTCMTTNALAIVNNEAVSHVKDPFGATIDPRDLLLEATILRTAARNLPSGALLPETDPLRSSIIVKLIPIFVYAGRWLIDVCA